jgi:hypothetical protein
MRHQVNANWVAELPFGRGKRYLNHLGPAAEAILGGWQLSGLWRMTSGVPISVLNVRGWPNGWCCPHYGEPIAAIPDQTHNKNAPLVGGGSGPNVFDNPSAALASFQPANVGPTSNRNNLRGQGVFTIDLGLGKRFRLPGKATVFNSAPKRSTLPTRCDSSPICLAPRRWKTRAASAITTRC